MMGRWRRQRAQRQAGVWMARKHRDNGSFDTQSFERWRQRRPENGRAWAEAEALWRAFDDPAAFPAEALETTSTTPVATWPRWAVGAAMALLAGILVVPQWQAVPDPRGQWQAVASRPLERQLPDGSSVVLAPGAALSWRYRTDERHLELLRGEAIFSVSHDASRPFRVRVDGTRVEALGTIFTVTREPDRVGVAVSEGRVAVSHREAREEVSRDRGVWVTAQGFEPLSAQAAGQLSSWREGRLVFDDRPLGRIAARLGRYLGKELVIVDPVLSQRRLSAVVDYRDPQTALETLALAADLRLEPESPHRVLLLPKSAETP